MMFEDTLVSTVCLERDQIQDDREKTSIIIPFLLNTHSSHPLFCYTSSGLMCRWNVSFLSAERITPLSSFLTEQPDQLSTYSSAAHGFSFSYRSQDHFSMLDGLPSNNTSP